MLIKQSRKNLQIWNCWRWIDTERVERSLHTRMTTKCEPEVKRFIKFVVYSRNQRLLMSVAHHQWAVTKSLLNSFSNRWHQLRKIISPSRVIVGDYFVAAEMPFTQTILLLQFDFKAIKRHRVQQSTIVRRTKFWSRSFSFRFSPSTRELSSSRLNLVSF